MHAGRYQTHTTMLIHEMFTYTNLTTTDTQKHLRYHIPMHLEEKREEVCGFLTQWNHCRYAVSYFIIMTSDILNYVGKIFSLYQG